MKVRTKPPKSWVVKTRVPKIGAQCKGVSDTFARRSKGRPMYFYKVETTKPSKKLRGIEAHKLLEASRWEEISAQDHAALQCVHESLLVLRAKRILATKHLACGSDIWRKILYQMVNLRYKILKTRHWVKDPMYYLLEKYLRYCMQEIRRCKDLVFGVFQFSLADLRGSIEPLGLVDSTLLTGLEGPC